MSASSLSPLPERVGAGTVLSLAWPVMISRVSDTIMAAVGMAFVSRLGTDAVAAVGLAYAGSHLIYSFGWGFLGAVRVLVSHRTGAGDAPGSTRMAWQGLWAALLFGISAWLTIPLVPWGLALSGADPGVLAGATEFLRMRALAAPLFFVTLALSGYFQGKGDTRTPMVGTVAANAVNLLLSPALIFGFGPAPAMGVSGAVWAWGAGMLAYVAVLVWRFLPVVRQGVIGPDRAELRAMSGPGLPMAMNLVQELGSFSLFTTFLAHAGAAHLAAHVLVARVIMCSFLPGWAIGEAGGVLVGQALGAGRPALARQAWRNATALCLVLMGAMGVLFVAVPEQLLSIFHPDAEVGALAVRMLWIASAFQLFDAVATVGLCCLNGAGDNRFSMAVSVVGSWCFKVPLAWLFAVPLGLGAPGAWIGMTFEIVALAGICVWRLRGDRWLGADAVAAEAQTAVA